MSRYPSLLMIRRYSTPFTQSSPKPFRVGMPASAPSAIPSQTRNENALVQRLDLRRSMLFMLDLRGLFLHYMVQLSATALSNSGTRRY